MTVTNPWGFLRIVGGSERKGASRSRPWWGSRATLWTRLGNASSLIDQVRFKQTKHRGPKGKSAAPPAPPLQEPGTASSPPSRSVRMREWARPQDTCSTRVSWGLCRGSGTGEGSSTYS